MIWANLLTELDAVRSRIRADERFKKSPRGVVPAEVAGWLTPLIEAIGSEEGPAQVTIELDSAGRPIIPDDLKGLFATAPEESRGRENEGAKVIRRNPVLESGSAKSGPKAVPLPRDTPRIEHPLDLEDATEATVAK